MADINIDAVRQVSAEAETLIAQSQALASRFDDVATMLMQATSGNTGPAVSALHSMLRGGAERSAQLAATADESARRARQIAVRLQQALDDRGL